MPTEVPNPGKFEKEIAQAVYQPVNWVVSMFDSMNADPVGD